MNLSTLSSLAFLAVTAGAPSCKEQATMSQSAADEIEFRGTAVATLDGERVGVAAVFKPDRPLADGRTPSGLAAQLVIGTAKTLEVTTGDTLQIGGAQWLVKSIEKPLIGPRRVVLRRTGS